MGDWFRNEEWTPEIEAHFEERLRRAKSQKAQYLRIQGSMLKDRHPAAAIGLLQRCVESGDESHVAAANLEAAHASYMLGDLDRALAYLEAAMDQEARQPMFRTSAAFDYAMLVALHLRTERFDKALAVLEGSAAPMLPAMDFQREAARAVILSAQGHPSEARAAAERALAAEAVEEGWIPGHPEIGVIANPNNPLSARIREILRESGT